MKRENRIWKYRNIIFVLGMFAIGIIVNIIAIICGVHGKEGYDWIAGLIFGLWIIWIVFWCYVEAYLDWKNYH